MKYLLSLLAFVLFHATIFSQCTLNPVINYSSNACGQQACFSVSTTGGTAPYTYSIPNGPSLTPNNAACWDIPGTYLVLVTDAAGCTGETTLTIQDQSTQNDACETATVLENGIQLTDTLCVLNFQNPVCSNMQFSQLGWYTFNSADFTHIEFGAFPSFSTSPAGVLQGIGIQILAAQNNGTCTEATEVFCGTISSCFSFEEHFTITPQTNYFIRVMAGWTSWVQVNVGVVLSDEPIVGACGCTNPLSCNYNPDAIIGNSSCGYNGCTDNSACNYVSYATCDDGSCLYGNDITGLLFNDINGNGLRDNWPTLEPTLANVGYLTIEELNSIVYPDASGSFVLPGLDLGTYSITFHNENNNWTITGGNNTLTITLPTCNGLRIPLNPSSGAAAQVSGSNMFSNSIIQCNNGFNPGVWIQNTGTIAIDGVFTMSFPATLSAQNLSYGVPFTSSSPGMLTWIINDMMPGTYQNLYTHILGPGVAFVGTTFPFTFSLSLSDQQNVFYTNTWTTNALVSCAYDPNDKQATPEGYTENHFILDDTELQYKIRFQNTGNAPAFDVSIEDQIDLSRFDLTTFEPLGASHSYSTIVEPSGMVRFVFNNIMLPDSNSNEPASHGFVIYKIRTHSELNSGDILNNTAAIYFDDNPPIITNTTQHKIYSCDDISFPEVLESTCEYYELDLISEEPFIEEYTWSLNNEVISTSEEIYNVLPASDYTLELEMSNPLCSVNHEWNISVYPVPNITGLEQSIYCEGEEVLVNASCDGCEITWDGGIENGQILDLTPGALAELYTAFAVNEYGCESFQEWIVSVNALPTPWIIVASVGGISTNLLEAEYPIMELDYQWYLNGIAIEGATLPFISAQVSGSYTLEATDDAGCSGMSLPIDFFVVGNEEINDDAISLYPNPAQEFVNLRVSNAHIGLPYEVFDVAGRLIQSAIIKNTNTLISLENLHSGNYVVKVGSFRKMIQH